jgi:hypothetical protein
VLYFPSLPAQEESVADPSLSDSLKDYISKNGRDTISFDKSPTLVIVGEIHAFLTGDPASIRTAASVRVLRELLKNQRFRYFGNESFNNAGPIRRSVRQYWETGTLPPKFDPKDAAVLDRTEIGRRVLTRRFQPVLDDLRASPRYILSIGSTVDGPMRDARLAQHLMEEMADRKLAPTVPGVIVLGASHAGAVPIRKGRTTTTRMVLERHGFSCISILVLTDFSRPGDDPDDLVTSAKDASAPIVELTSAMSKSPVSFKTDGAGFKDVVWLGSDSGHTLAEEYEIIFLQKA